MLRGMMIQMEVVIMLNTYRTNYSADRDDLCDVRIWSAECEHTSSQTSGDKYLCGICDRIPNLDHEVKAATLCYVSGDYDRLY